MLKVKIYKTTEGPAAWSTSALDSLIGVYVVENFSVSAQVNASPSFSFEIGFNQFSDYPVQEHTQNSFKFYMFDTLLYTGLIESVSIDYVKKSIKFNCEDWIYLLFYHPPYAFARFENANLSSILSVLTETIAVTRPRPNARMDWNSSLASYGAGITTVTTVDLSNEENLLGQILSVLATIPGTYLVATGLDRYVQYSLGLTLNNPNRMFKLARYESTPIFNLDPANIKSLTTDEELSAAITEVTPYGAEYDAAGTPSILTLADKTIADTPGFTTVISSFVRNTTLASSLQYQQLRGAVVIFDDIKTKTLTSPSGAQRRRASNALYLKTVRFLQQQSVEKRYHVSVDQDLSGIEIGNRVNIVYPITDRVIQQSTGVVSDREMSRLDPSGVYYVESYRANYSNQGVVFDLSVVSDPYFVHKDPDVKAYNSKKQQKIKTYNTVPSLPPVHAYYETTVGPGLAANCGGIGRSVTFVKASGDFGGTDAGSIPAANAATTRYWVDITPLDSSLSGSFTATLDPGVVNNNFTLCVSLDGNWTTANSARVRVLLEYP